VRVHHDLAIVNVSPDVGVILDLGFNLKIFHVSVKEQGIKRREFSDPHEQQVAVTNCPPPSIPWAANEKVASH
jgi:hypothetical protein